jgi:Tol biopolymer transport system component
VRVDEAPGADLVFARRTAAGGWELVRQRLGTATPGEAVRLASGVAADRPAPSPDGRRLAVTGAYYDLVTGQPSRVVDVRDREGAMVRQLAPNAMVQSWEPAWSPDGSRVAFSCGPLRERGTPHVCVIGADGSGFADLTAGRSAAAEEAPSWSPDGTRLAFSASDAGGSAIWTMRADGTDRRRLTTLGGQNRHPAWSPDGARIAFDHFDFHAGESDVRLVPAAGGAATTLPGTEDGGSIAPQTAWSPDGRFVAFVRLVDGTAELFTMRVDGTALRRRTTGGAGRDVAAPAWLTR